MYAPIAGDLEATERILHKSLSSSRPGVAELMGYLGNYRGKRLGRPCCCSRPGPAARSTVRIICWPPWSR